MYSIDPPEGVKTILRVLENDGFRAYTVGGCIRDSVMGRKPKDWDIATNAHPDDVRRLFGKTVDTGIAHGTVSVILDGISYEVTTFRIDGRYKDGRHPETVVFTTNIEDDLRRRDFTINAMAWNPSEGIIDPFGGISDIACRTIRTVDDPKERFREDALRMLRAVRFASVLGFEIEERTYTGIRENSSLISRISAERIREELNGILVSDDPGKFIILKDTGLLRLIIPELDACFGGDNGLDLAEHCLMSVSAVEADPCLRWTMLLHGLYGCPGGKTDGTAENAPDILDRGYVEEIVEEAGLILSRLKFDNKSKNKILRLIRHLWIRPGTDRRSVARAVIEVGGDLFADLLKAKKAHITAELIAAGNHGTGRTLRPDTANDNTIWDSVVQNRTGEDAFCGCESTKNELCELEMTEKAFASMLNGRYCLGLKDLALNGNDLKRLGFREGSIIGRTLEFLLDRVIDEPDLNNKEALEKIALGFLKKNEGEMAQDACSFGQRC